MAPMSMLPNLRPIIPAIVLCVISTHGAAATSCIDGEAAGFPCDAVDLAERVPLAAITTAPSSANDVWGFVDLNSHREYVLMGVRTGTAVFDVTDPAAPVEVGFVPGQATTWRDIKTYQFFDAAEGRWRAYAYVTADAVTEGLFVIDLGDLPNGVAKVVYASDIASAHNLFAANVDVSTGLVLDGAVAQLAIAGSSRDDGRFRLYSLSDPAAPAFRATSDLAADTHDLAGLRIQDARKDTQCVNAAAAEACDLLLDFGEDAVDIWDITLPDDPVRLSQTSYPNLGFVHSGWWSEDGQYVFVHDEFDELQFGLQTRLIVLSVADLTAPTVAGSWTGPSNAIDHNGYARGNRYYLSNYTRGLTILDITDAAAPVAVGRFDTHVAGDATDFDGAWGVYPFLWSGTIAVSDIDAGLFLLEDRTRDVAAGRLSFGATAAAAVEGAPATLAVRRTGGGAGAVTVDYELVPAAADGTDVDTTGGRLSWADGDTSDRSVAIDTVADGAAEGLESVIVRLVNPGGGATLGETNVAMVYVSDPGAASELRLLEDRVTVAEDGAGQAVLVVRRTGSATGAARVDYAVSGGTAAEGGDYDAFASGTLAWADGDGSPRSLVLRIVDDGDAETDETVELALTNPQGAVVAGAALATVTIVDDDGAPPPAPVPPTASRPRSSGGGTPGPALLLLLGALAVRRLNRTGFA